MCSITSRLYFFFFFCILLIHHTSTLHKGLYTNCTCGLFILKQCDTPIIFFLAEITSFISIYVFQLPSRPRCTKNGSGYSLQVQIKYEIDECQDRSLIKISCDIPVDTLLGTQYWRRGGSTIAKSRTGMTEKTSWMYLCIRYDRNQWWDIVQRRDVIIARHWMVKQIVKHG